MDVPQIGADRIGRSLFSEIKYSSYRRSNSDTQTTPSYEFLYNISWAARASRAGAARYSSNDTQTKGRGAKAQPAPVGGGIGRRTAAPSLHETAQQKQGPFHALGPRHKQHGATTGGQTKEQECPRQSRQAAARQIPAVEKAEGAPQQTAPGPRPHPARSHPAPQFPEKIAAAPTACFQAPGGSVVPGQGEIIL